MSGGITQGLECWFVIPKVVGSNPISSVIFRFIYLYGNIRFKPLGGIGIHGRFKICTFAGYGFESHSG